MQATMYPDQPVYRSGSHDEIKNLTSTSRVPSREWMENSALNLFAAAAASVFSVPDLTPSTKLDHGLSCIPPQVSHLLGSATSLPLCSLRSQIGRRSRMAGAATWRAATCPRMAGAATWRAATCLQMPGRQLASRADARHDRHAARGRPGRTDSRGGDLLWLGDAEALTSWGTPKLKTEHDLCFCISSGIISAKLLLQV